jgi:hypothetical protein
LHDKVKLTSDNVLTTGGNITFNEVVNGAKNLTVNADSLITFKETIGKETALASLTTGGTGSTIILHNPNLTDDVIENDAKAQLTVEDNDISMVITTGDQTYGNTLITNSNFESLEGNITLTDVLLLDNTPKVINPELFPANAEPVSDIVFKTTGGDIKYASITDRASEISSINLPDEFKNMASSVTLKLLTGESGGKAGSIEETGANDGKTLNVYSLEITANGGFIGFNQEGERASIRRILNDPQGRTAAGSIVTDEVPMPNIVRFNDFRISGAKLEESTQNFTMNIEDIQAGQDEDLFSIGGIKNGKLPENLTVGEAIIRGHDNWSVLGFAVGLENVIEKKK